MSDHARSPEGAKALIAGIDARVAELDAVGSELMEEFRTHDVAIRLLVKQLQAIQKEVRELEAMKRRYTRRPSKAVEEQDAEDERPGATDAVFSLLQSAPNRQLPVNEVLQHLESGMRAGVIRTQTTDPRKLASSVVGNLVRQKRLVRQVHRDGDVIILAAENGKP